MSWPTIKLTDVAQVFNGKTPSKLEQRTSGKPVLKIKDVNEFGSFKGSFNSFVDFNLFEKYEDKALQLNDTLLLNAAHNSEYVGSKHYRVESSVIGALPTGEWLVVRPKDRELDSIFLNHWFRSPEAKYQIKNLVKGIHLYPKDVGRILIPFPALSEQKHIAAILDKADNIRRKRQQAIKLADEFLRAAFLEMFGDPVINPKGFNRRFIKEFYVDEKNGTKCGPFGSALKKDEYRESGIPVWNMDNISLVGDFFDDPKLWVAEEKFNDLASYSVINGDVIISRAGTVGKMGVVRTKHEKSLLSTNLIRVRFNSKLKPEFFVALMTYCKGRVGRLKVGPDGAFTHMNTGIIDSIEFPYPPVDLQEKFLAIVNRTKTQILKNVVFQNKIDETHSAISQRAFSGQL